MIFTSGGMLRKLRRRGSGLGALELETVDVKEESNDKKVPSASIEPTVSL